MITTWSDEETEGESKDETTNRVISFMGKFKFDDGASNEDISYEELAEAYKLLYIKWKEACIYGQQKKKLVLDLQTEKNKLTKEVALLNSKLEGMTKSIRMMSKSTDVLDEILVAGKSVGDMKGIGFNYGILNKGSKKMSKEYKSVGRQSGFRMSNHKSKQWVQH